MQLLAPLTHHECQSCSSNTIHYANDKTKIKIYFKNPQKAADSRFSLSCCLSGLKWMARVSALIICPSSQEWCAQAPAPLSTLSGQRFILALLAIRR